MSLRERLLVVLVAIAGVWSLASAEMGILFYTGFAVMRPDIVAYAEGTRYSAGLAICVLLGSVLRIGQLPRLFLSPITLLFLFLQVPILLSVIYSSAPEYCWNYYIPFLQASALALLIPVLVESDRTFKLLVMIIAGGIGFHGLKYGVSSLFFFGGARIIVGPGGYMSDNNTFALGLTIAVAMCWFCASMAESRWIKAMFWAMTLLSMATIIQTHSRGGIIGLACVILFIAYHSKRGLLTLAFFAVLAAPVVFLVRDTLIARMATLTLDSEEGSFQGRQRLALTAIKAVPDHFLLGAGFGGEVFARMAAVVGEDGKLDVHVVHNNYLEMQLGSGIFATLAFQSMVFGSIWWLGRVRKRWREARPDLAAASLALQGGLVAFAIGALFISRTYYDVIYIMLMTVSAWQIVSGRMLREREIEAMERGFAAVSTTVPEPAVPELNPARRETAHNGPAPQAFSGEVWRSATPGLRAQNANDLIGRENTPYPLGVRDRRAY